MKIALVGAEIEENLAMRSIAASLEGAGHDVRLHDFRSRDQLLSIAERLAREGAPLAGFSMIFTARAREFVDLARAARSAGYRGHLTAGGHFASLHAEELLAKEPSFDSVIHGDGEEPMVELAARLDAPETVAGMTLRDASGEILTTAPRRNLDDLDARPWPKRPPRFHEYLGFPIANLLSSRGCYGKCAFCSIDAFHRRCAGKRFRQRRPEEVAREMAALYHERGVRIFNFQDDNFFLRSPSRNLARFEALEAALHEHQVGPIAIQAKGRPDCIDEGVIAKLKGMGLFRLFLGVETDAVSGLETLNRGMERADNHRALEILRRQRIHTCFNLLIFDPGSTIEVIRQNVDFMRRQDWFPLNFCRVEIYGGTPMQARLEAEGRLLGDYLGYTYRIADERAQRAYLLFRQVFWPRNFSFDGAHFGTMRVDYHFHLLERFFPDRVTAELEAEVKSITRDLNRHSAELMDRLLDFACTEPSLDPGASRSFAAALEAERARVDHEVRERIAAAIRRIESLAATAPDRRQFLKAATATAAAATLAVAAPGCHRRENTHMVEAPPPDDTHMVEAPPPPDNVPVEIQPDDTHMVEAPPPPDNVPIEIQRDDTHMVEAPPPPDNVPVEIPIGGTPDGEKGRK